MGSMTANTSRELSFVWEGLELVGTLRLPAGSGPHAAVLMMQVSGPADRENDVYFAEIREAFLPKSIATFSFDKPGCGASSVDWRVYGLLARGDQA